MKPENWTVFVTVKAAITHFGEIPEDGFHFCVQESNPRFQRFLVARSPKRTDCLKQILVGRPPNPRTCRDFVPSIDGTGFKHYPDNRGTSNITPMEIWALLEQHFSQIVELKCLEHLLIEQVKDSNGPASYKVTTTPAEAWERVAWQARPAVACMGVSPETLRTEGLKALGFVLAPETVLAPRSNVTRLRKIRDSFGLPADWQADRPSANVLILPFNLFHYKRTGKLLLGVFIGDQRQLLEEDQTFQTGLWLPVNGDHGIPPQSLLNCANLAGRLGAKSGEDLLSALGAQDLRDQPQLHLWRWLQVDGHEASPTFIWPEVRETLWDKLAQMASAAVEAEEAFRR